MSSSSMGPASASPPLQRAPPPPVAISHLNSNHHTHHHHQQHQHHHHPHILSSNHIVNSSQQRSHPQSPTTTITTTTTTPLPSSEDDLLAQLSREELISRIRSLEAKNRKLLYDNGSMMKDINHHLSTIQQLKATNYQLVTSNGELREMCCHLDDERSRSKAIAKEWQSFGTHMSRVMRHEVTNYSNKLSQLEAKQFELVRENFELKQLCLLLDNAIATRESGDGTSDTPLRTEGVGASLTSSQTTSSSSSSPPSASINGQSVTLLGINSNCSSSSRPQQQHRVVLSQQILEYIRNLESKIQQLEWEKKQLCDLHSNADSNQDSFENNSVTHSEHNNNNNQCPAAIAEAMRVLRIHESLDVGTQVRSSTSGQSTSTPSAHILSDQNTSDVLVGETDAGGGGVAVELDEVTLEQQKAIVRSLCNVAWRKIEDGAVN